MDLAGKKILVTGADGFIGSHLVDALVHQGCDVRAFVQYNSFNSWGWLDDSPPEFLKNIDVVAGDIRDPHGILKAMRGCNVVFHLAALIAIPYSYNSPTTYIDTNITGTLNVVQAALDLGVERVIQTSTSEVYGTAIFVPITEDHPLQGQSPYSASKIGADQLALSFYRSFGVPVAVIRPFNTYGPRQSARAVIPTIITQLLSGVNTIKLGATTPTRDFNFVSDTVEGFLRVAEADEAIGEVINIGSGFEISIGDLAMTISKVMGRPLNIEVEDVRLRPEKSEVERLLAANKKALEICGWTPRHSGLNGLEAGLKVTADWFADQSNLARYKINTYNI